MEMPLQKGVSKEVISSNIAELLTSFKKGGKFAKGKSSKKAQQMAIAAAFDMKRRSKKGKK